MSRFHEMNEKLVAAKTSLRNEGRLAFEEAVREFLARFPEVQTFSFYQYTPSFNDGDPCYNRLGGPFVHLAGDEIENPDGRLTEDNSSDPRGSANPRDPVELEDALHAFELAEAALELIYGTNIEFRATRGPDGIVFKESYYDCGY